MNESSFSEPICSYMVSVGWFGNPPQKWNLHGTALKFRMENQLPMIQESRHDDLK